MISTRRSTIFPVGKVAFPLDLSDAAQFSLMVFQRDFLSDAAQCSLLVRAPSPWTSSSSTAGLSQFFPLNFFFPRRGCWHGVRPVVFVDVVLVDGCADSTCCMIIMQLQIIIQFHYYDYYTITLLCSYEFYANNIYCMITMQLQIIMQFYFYDYYTITSLCNY